MALEREQDEVQRALQRTQLVLVCLTKAYMDAIASSVRPPRPRHPARPAAGLVARPRSLSRASRMMCASACATVHPRPGTPSLSVEREHQGRVAQAAYEYGRRG